MSFLASAGEIALLGLFVLGVVSFVGGIMLLVSDCISEDA
jgi:hypothetical protein